MPTKKTKTAAKSSVKEVKATALAKGKKKILIIEDEKPLAHALELKMTHEGYETTVCSTGEEGLREALTGKYQLILLDLILPGIDGFTILQEMKNKKMKTIVIILSNLGQDEDRAKAKEFGAKDYLIKSNVPLSDIVKVVKAAI
jgi:two-component system, OmpR family, response regulator ArlR